jgi:hypothetical protein
MILGSDKMPTASEFFGEFIKSYKRKRDACRDEWHDIWTDTNRWSCFMIYDNDSVIRKIALNGLTCFPREPLHIDAIFTSTERWDWFPIEIAIEHENNPIGFHGEINKLISIHSPLKVGITYSILDGKDIAFVKNKVNTSFKESFKKCPSTYEEEYLFIIGFENPDQQREIEWHYAIIKPNAARIDNLNWVGVGA